MKKVFNNDFFQFSAGFLLIVLGALAVIFITQAIMDRQDTETQRESSERMLPVATTSAELEL